MSTAATGCSDSTDVWKYSSNTPICKHPVIPEKVDGVREAGEGFMWTALGCLVVPILIWIFVAFWEGGKSSGSSSGSNEFVPWWLGTVVIFFIIGLILYLCGNTIPEKIENDKPYTTFPCQPADNSATFPEHILEDPTGKSVDLTNKKRLVCKCPKRCPNKDGTHDISDKCNNKPKDAVCSVAPTK